MVESIGLNSYKFHIKFREDPQSNLSLSLLFTWNKVAILGFRFWSLTLNMPWNIFEMGFFFWEITHLKGWNSLDRSEQKEGAVVNIETPAQYVREFYMNKNYIFLYFSFSFLIEIFMEIYVNIKRR